MSTKPNPAPPEPKPESDLAAFERLPEETKELMKLKEKEERTSGPEHAETTREIEKTADKPPP